MCLQFIKFCVEHICHHITLYYYLVCCKLLWADKKYYIHKNQKKQKLLHVKKVIYWCVVGAGYINKKQIMKIQKHTRIIAKNQQ